MRDPEMALEVHAREELGIDPRQLGSPVGAATSSFVAFCVGAVIPLVPWLFLEGDVAVGASVLLGAIAALAIGAIIGVISERPIWFTALRQLLVGAVAGAVTYGVGSLLGVQIS
jgi:VIT1/CCC1 family predicted Fe2+/Mn2+ transporter